MGDVEDAADGIGQGVNGCDRGVGECLSGQHGTQQHCLAGSEVVPALAGTDQVAG